MVPAGGVARAGGRAHALPQAAERELESLRATSERQRGGLASSLEDRQRELSHATARLRQTEEALANVEEQLADRDARLARTVEEFAEAKARAGEVRSRASAHARPLTHTHLPPS